MEVQPPVSPQQSECNPVGALQVCPHPHFPCMPVFPWTWGCEGRLCGSSSPVLRAFPTPLRSFSLEFEAPRVGGRGCKESFLTLPCAPLFLPLKELVVQKGWRLPEYTVTQESGPAHRKEFTMTCRVERFIEIGNWAEGSS